MTSRLGAHEEFRSVWPAWLSWITTRWAIKLTMPTPRSCVASWSACSAFGAVPVPPSSVTHRATTWEETARARWKLPDRCPLAVYARVSFAKVAEYQKRGAVHFRAVIRIDGPETGDTPLPAWATAELLTNAIGSAAAHVSVDGPARTRKAIEHAHEAWKPPN